MPTCKFCNQDNLEWYQDAQDKWHLGTKLDINIYRPHKCVPQNENQGNNKRNWVKFNCKKCGKETRQNLKLIKTLNLCIECSNQ